MRVRLHQTSLTHNLWKLWRRSVCLLEQCLLSASIRRALLHSGDWEGPPVAAAERPRGTGAPCRCAAKQPHGRLYGFTFGVASRGVDHAPGVPCPLRTGASERLGTHWFRRRLGSVCRSVAAQSAATTGHTQQRMRKKKFPAETRVWGPALRSFTWQTIGPVTGATMNCSLMTTSPSTNFATRLSETPSGAPWASTKRLEASNLRKMSAQHDHSSVEGQLQSPI